MKLVLIKNEVLLVNQFNPLTKSQSTGELDTSAVQDNQLYNYNISFNNGPYIQVKAGKFDIPSITSDVKEVHITVVATNAANSKSLLFRTQLPIPVETYLQFGAPLDKVYPEIVYELRSELRKALLELRAARNGYESENIRLQEEGDII